MPGEREKRANHVTHDLPSFFVVRPKGLEPPRLSALDPKSSAAANYATAAKQIATDCTDCNGPQRYYFSRKNPNR